MGAQKYNCNRFQSKWPLERKKNAKYLKKNSKILLAVLKVFFCIPNVVMKILQSFEKYWWPAHQI